MRYLWFSLLLALGARGAVPPPRGLPRIDSIERLLDARQVVSITSDPPVVSTQPVISTGFVVPDPLVTSSVVAPLTTNPVSTTINSIPTTSNPIPTTSNVPATTIQSILPTTTSSVPLLYTRTSTSTSPSSSATNTPTSAPVTDINVPFSQSKYHQMIIALSCFAVGLLVAFIVTVIIALRARADVELLRDRLNQFEGGISMGQRKDGSGCDIGYEASRSFGQQSYGRVSMNDPDDATGSHPRQSVSEGQFASLPSTTSGKGGMAKGVRPQPGQRRVTFSADDHPADASPLLSTTTSRDSAPQYTHTQPLAPAPKLPNPYGSPALVQSPPQLTSSPPQSNFVSTPFAPPLVHPPSLQPRMSDPGRVATPPIRRLPTTPGASNGGHEGSGYTDPYTSNHGRSASGNYPPS